MLVTDKTVKYTWICDICGGVIEEMEDLVQLSAEYGFNFLKHSMDVHRGCLDILLPKGVSLSK